MLLLRCLCLGLLWMRPWRVAAALILGPAMVFVLASATRLGRPAYPGELRAWLHTAYLPNPAAAAGIWAGQSHCGFLPGPPPGGATAGAS